MLPDFFLVTRDGRDQVLPRAELTPADFDHLVARERTKAMCALDEALRYCAELASEGTRLATR